jgi:hypothetical protein
MTTKFTPGPWTAKEWCCHAATTVLSGDTVVAECSGHGRPSADSIADAKLIAAAPEMYEALKDAILLIESYKTARHSDILVNARIAIAKADGGQQ